MKIPWILREFCTRPNKAQMICIEIYSQFRFSFCCQASKDIFHVRYRRRWTSRGSKKVIFCGKSCHLSEANIYRHQKKSAKKTRFSMWGSGKMQLNPLLNPFFCGIFPLLNPSFLRNFPLAEVCWFVFLGGRPPSAAAKQPIRCLFDFGVNDTADAGDRWMLFSF